MFIEILSSQRELGVNGVTVESEGAGLCDVKLATAGSYGSKNSKNSVSACPQLGLAKQELAWDLEGGNEAEVLTCRMPGWHEAAMAEADGLASGPSLQTLVKVSSSL